MTPENLQPPEIMIEDNQTPEELEDPPVAAAASCSPLEIAVSGYLKNRLSLVESLGKVSFVYGQNGHDKAKRIQDEIARIDAIVAGLVSPENARAMTPATESDHGK